LLFTGIAIVVLAALLAVLLLLPQPEDNQPEDPTETEDTSVVLLDKTGGENDEKVTVSKVTVTTGGETYSLTANEDGELFVDGYEGLTHDSDECSGLAAELQGIVADRLIAEVPENLKDFGFGTEDGAASAVSVVYSDDSTYAFEIGNEAPSGDGRYFREQGKSAVYLYNTASASTFLAKSTDYLSKSPITSPDIDDSTEATEDYVVVRDVELTGSVREKPVFFQISANETGGSIINAASLSGYVVQKPYYHGMDSESPLIETTAYTSLTASDIAKVHPTAADLQAYGLNDPYSACTFNLAVQRATTEVDDEGKETGTTYSYYNVFKYTVKMGKKNEDGLRYTAVYAEGKLMPIVYLVDESSVEWAEAQYDDIVNKLLFVLYIGEVKTVSITLDGETTLFELEHIESDNGGVADLIVTTNGKTCDTQGFRKLYESLMSVLRTDSIDEKPTGEPVFTLKMVTNDKDISGVDVELYRYSASKYLVKHASGEMYLANAKDAEAMMQACRDYIG
jgi:hypothetical protein